MVKVRSGTSKPHASKPPAKFSAASSRPNDVAHAEIRGTDVGRRHQCSAARNGGGYAGICAGTQQQLLSEVADFYRKGVVGIETLTAPSRYINAAEAHVGKQNLCGFGSLLTGLVNFGGGPRIRGTAGRDPPPLRGGAGSRRECRACPDHHQGNGFQYSGVLTLGVNVGHRPAITKQGW